jgi:hypothetical protein
VDGGMSHPVFSILSYNCGIVLSCYLLQG